MSNKGVITKGIYRKALTALAMMMVMSVVFAFTFTAQTHRIHADTVQLTADRWSQLKTHIGTANDNKGNTYEITITEDLVASEKIDVSGNVVLKSSSQKTIYREKGKTDFSVFNVKSGGNLEITGNVKMTGDTAEAETVPTTKKSKISFVDGQGNVIYEFEFNPATYASESDSNATTVNSIMYGNKIPRYPSDVSNPGNGAWFPNSYDDLKNTWYKYLRDLAGTSPYKHGYTFNGWNWPNNDSNYMWKPLKSFNGTLTVVAKWAAPNYNNSKQPLSSWAEVDKNTQVNGYVLLGYTETDANGDTVLWCFGVQTTSSETNPGVTTNRNLFRPFKTIANRSDGTGISNEAGDVSSSEGLFRWVNKDISNPSYRQLIARRGNPSAAGYPWDDANAQSLSFHKNDETAYTRIGLNTDSGSNYYRVPASISNGRILMHRQSGTGYAYSNRTRDDDGVTTSVTRKLVRSTSDWGIALSTGNFNTDKTKVGNDLALGFYSLSQARAMYAEKWTKPDDKTTAGYSEHQNTGGGKIKSGSVKTNVEYTKNSDDVTANTDDTLELFTGKEGNKGFFVHVDKGGTFTLSGAASGDNSTSLEKFNTVKDEKKTPIGVAPVYICGTFNMTGGAIQNNSVGYYADETKSKNKTIQEIKSYLDKSEFTNTAGGVIFDGNNDKNPVTSYITGGRIRSNKGDAGGIIVTKNAKVELGTDEGADNSVGINKNLGFHHGGAALVDNGGMLYMKKSGEMSNNVTWARGGGVWATQWGTNGYVDANWSGWPNSYPTVENPEIRGADGHFIMTGGNIHGNTAFIRAGAIEVESNGVELYGGNIYNNNCRSLGGAIYVEGDSADYSYTLYVNEGYIGQNIAVQKTNTSQKSVNADAGKRTTNNVLDRYLNNGELAYPTEHDASTQGTTFDRDFNGHMGNGGGVWLCPVGGTSVFASGDNQVTIDSNTATGTGTDFFLSRGNGSVMVQNLVGEWYKQPKGTNDAPLTFDGTNGTILNGPLPLINDVSPAVTKDNYDGGGVKIYNNQSRDGGGIACNGTLMLGGPKNVYRYDARVNIEKEWENNYTPETNEKVIVDLYYKENGKIKGDSIKSIELDGKKDVTLEDYTDEEEVSNVGGLDIEGEWASSGNKWRAAMLLPPYVEIRNEETNQIERKPLYTFSFKVDGQTYTLDPAGEVPENTLTKLVEAVNAEEDKKLELNVTSNFELVERGSKYKVEYTGLSKAFAVATSKQVTLVNPAANTDTASFHVTFSSAILQGTIKNYRAKDVSVAKKWIGETGTTELLRSDLGLGEVDRTSTNPNPKLKEYINWSTSGAGGVRFELKNGSTSVQNAQIHTQGIKKLIAGEDWVVGNTTWKYVAPATGKKYGTLVRQGNEKATLSLERNANTDDYYAVTDSSGNVLYSMKKSDADSQWGQPSTAKQKVLEAAIAKFREMGRHDLADATYTVGDGMMVDRVAVYTPTLTFNDKKYDADNNEIGYTVVEKIGAEGYTGTISPTTASNSFTATNTTKYNYVPVGKEWKDNKGNYILTQSYQPSSGAAIEFKKDNTPVWVNWPKSGVDSITLKLKSKTAGGTDKSVVVTAANIQTLLNGGTVTNNGEVITLTTKTVGDKTVYFPVVSFKTVKANGTTPYEYEASEDAINNYDMTVTSQGSAGSQKFTVTNNYNKTEIPATKVWKDYDGNIVMSQIGDKWVNWPANGVDFVRLKIEDKSVSPAWEKIEALQKGSVQTALANSNGKTGTWDIAGRGKGYVKVEGKDYYVVQEKATGNKLVMTVPASDASTADAAIAVASQKFGIPATDLEVAGNAVRTIYFPSIVFDIAGKNNNGDIAKYVITELGVGTGGYSDNATIRSDDYVPSYVDADGNTIDVTASITDAAAHMATMEDGITIVNDRKVNVKLTKKWKDGSTNTTTWPTTGVTSVAFELLKYNEETEKFEVVENKSKTLTKDNSTLEWTGLDPGRYKVREKEVKNNNTVVNSYDTEVSDVTITQDSTKNNQDVFNYTVTNTELTDVQVTKKWNGQDTWPSKISSVNLYLKRWYKYDSFGREIWKRKLNSDTTKSNNTYSLHILKKGTNGSNEKKYVQLDSNNNQYYVEDNGKNYVKDNGYVVIDNMIYALQGGTTNDDYIIRDHNNNKEIVLVDAKDVNGNPITTPSQATSSAATVYWRNLPKYDEEFPVSSTLNDAEKWNVRKIMYWIAEDPITGYLETVVNSPAGNEYSFRVNNTSVDNYTINVNAQKFWNDGGYTSDRPTIKFELWRAKYYRYYGYWVYDEDGDGAWSKLTGQDSSGHDYDRVITPDMAGSDLTQTWVNLPKQDRTYSYDYAPREAILVGKKANGQEVYVYLNDLSDATMDDENNYPSRGELVITGNATSGYTATVYKLDKDGKRTSTTIATATGITELEESVKGYQTISKYDDTTANGCRGFNLKAYNTKPAIEKYVEKDVHKDLDNMTDEFTYDIMAYVPKWSKSLVIKDTLIPALQYVRTNNDVNPTVAFGVTNDHKANGSVSDTTNYTTLSKTEGGKTNYSYQGGDTGNFVLTINEDGVKKILADNADNGKWVRVTLKAKIKDRVVIDGKSVPFEDLTAEQLTAIGFKTVEDNTPVISTISKHTGFKNKASYDLTLDNGFEFKNIESNEVTVVPPATLEVEKKVTGTLGDLNKEFVFHIELNNLQAREGKPENQTDYEYEVPNGTSVNPKSGDGIEVYRAETMTENDKTYSNGFNLETNNSTTKHLYVKLKAKEKLKIKGLQVGVKYKVTEYASDHVPSYSINDINNVKEVTREVTLDDIKDGRMVKEGNNWVKAESKHMDGTQKTVAANVKMKDGAGKNEVLSTSTETVDPGEIVVITYTNHRDIETQTGIIKDTWPWNIILLVLLILLAYDDQMRKIKNRLRLQRLTTTV